MPVNPADYRSGGASGRASAADAAQGRALQSEFAKSYGIWYRPGAQFAIRTSTAKGHKGHKAHKPRVIHKHRHHEALASGATVDPFHNRGAARGF